MSFREKMHWVALVSIALAFGWYFVNYPWSQIAEPRGWHISRAMLYIAVLAIIGLMTLATAIFAIRSPDEAHLKEDERDRVIHIRGTHWAYYPLVLGVWAGIFAAFFGVSQVAMLNLLLASVVLAELVRVGSQLYFYRRGY